MTRIILTMLSPRHDRLHVMAELLIDKHVEYIQSLDTVSSQLPDGVDDPGIDAFIIRNKMNWHII